MAESDSMMLRASRMMVNLVNPRFVNFNKPLCLAISVAFLSILGFLPVLGYYLFEETVLVTDNSRQDVTLLTGPQKELDAILVEYARVPPRCTPSGSSHAYITGTGETTSADGLVRKINNCTYDFCILRSYNYQAAEPLSTWGSLVYDRVEVEPDSWGGGAVPIPLPSWSDCRIQDEWLLGLVKSALIPIYTQLNNHSGNHLLQTGCNLGTNGAWCNITVLTETYKWLGRCCRLGLQNQVSPECGPQAWTPQSNVTFGGICMPFMTDMEHYLEARAADPHQSPALYKLCPDDSPFSVALSETLPKCNLVGFGGGMRQWEPISLKVLWTQNETITTYTKARFQDAFADASALSTRIEMVVTVVVILLFRQLGIVKEIKAFSWGELSDIVQEKPDEKKEEEEREKKMEEWLQLKMKEQNQQKELAASDLEERIAGMEAGIMARLQAAQQNSAGAEAANPRRIPVKVKATPTSQVGNQGPRNGLGAMDLPNMPEHGVHKPQLHMG